MKNILLITDSIFFIKNFEEYINQNNLKYKLIILNQNNIKKKKFPKNIFFSIVNLGMSGGIEFNINNGCKILNYNTETYLSVLNYLKKKGIKNLFFISASCVYPKNLKLLNEKSFGCGKIEPTSFHYAASKLIGSFLCASISVNKNYRWLSVIPATLYGKYSKNDKKNSHVINSFFEKFKKKGGVIKLWGSGKPKREFLHIQDFIGALFFIKEKKIYRNVINVGYGEDISIKKLADIFQIKSKFRGVVKWDKTKPDGAKKKLLDSSFIFSKGWRPKINLIKGISDILDQ